MWYRNSGKMILHLIRHGKTPANENRLYCGATDIPLSSDGEKELNLLKEKLSYHSGDLYIVSGLVRTVQTLNILFDSPEYTVIDKLREINFGDFEMKSYDELKARSDYQSWINNIENSSPPNGESRAEFIKRIQAGFEEVKNLCKEKSAQSAVIVAHGGVIASWLEGLFPNEQNFYQWQPDCGRGYSLSFKKDTGIELAKI